MNIQPKRSCSGNTDLMFFCSGVLIAVGSVLLGFVRIKFAKSRVSDKAGERFGRSGSRGAGLLGILFALSFCPVSAALFFGSLFPLAVKNGSSLLRPSAYGAGTGVPVFVFGVPIALGAQWVQGIPEACPVRKVARRLTGAIFRHRRNSLLSDLYL